MTAKKYLQQAYYLSRRIDDAKDELARLREQAYNVASVDTEKDKIQTGVACTTSAAALEIVELEMRINKQINEFAVKRNEIEKNINKVQCEQMKSILLMRYINFKSLKEIARKMNYSYVHIKRIHGKSIHYFEKNIDF